MTNEGITAKHSEIAHIEITMDHATMNELAGELEQVMLSDESDQFTKIRVLLAALNRL